MPTYKTEAQQIMSPIHQTPSPGLNFAPTPRQMPYKEIIAAMKNGLCRIPEEVADSARSRIIGILSKASPPSSNLSTGERRAIKLFQDDDDILILPADKGRATVVMDRQDYEQKILLLEDSHTYKKLAKDPAQCLERKMNAMLLELKRKGSISEQLYSHLRCSAG